MLKQELKQKLLATAVILDNEYLDSYINLIINNLDTKQTKFITQKHHIIPRCYYKYNDLKVDNSKDNLVNLVYKDHILAHCYLELCSKPNSWFLGSNYYSIYKLAGNMKLSKEDLILIVNNSLPEFFTTIKARGVLSDEHKKHLSLSQKGRYGNITGYKMLYDTFGVRRYVKPEEVVNYLAKGYTQPQNKKYQQIDYSTNQKHIYVSHMTQEEKHEHLSKAHLGLPAHNKEKPCSDEQKAKISATITGSKWMNNGSVQLQVKQNEIENYIANGYIFGRLKQRRW